MITTTITGSIYPMMSLVQNSQFSSDPNGYMNEVRSVQVSQEFTQAMIEHTEETRVKNNEFVADAVDVAQTYEPPKGHIVDEWA